MSDPSQPHSDNDPISGQEPLASDSGGYGRDGQGGEDGQYGRDGRDGHHGQDGQYGRGGIGQRGERSGGDRRGGDQRDGYRPRGERSGGGGRPRRDGGFGRPRDERGGRDGRPAAPQQRGGGLRFQPRTAREVAAYVLIGVFSGPIDDAAAAVHEGASRARLSDADHRLAFQLTHLVLRHGEFLDQFYSCFFSESPDRLRLESRIIMRMSVAQKLLLDRIPDHAIGDEAVRLAKEFFRLHAGETAFVNAIVRKIVAREYSGSELEDLDRPFDRFRDRGLAPLSEAARRSSCPPWIVDILATSLGVGTWAELPNVINGVAPVALRANVLATTPTDLAVALQEEGVATRPGTIAAPAMYLQDAGDLPRLVQTRAFAAGHFYIQDEASQLVAIVARPQAGERVLDLCAAPGGKATHLAELTGGKAEVVATDYSDRRFVLIEENLGRLRTPGIQAVPWGKLVVRGDGSPSFGAAGANRQQDWDSPVAQGSDHAAPGHRGLYDLVVLDAPCSALGTLRRHPELRYRLRPDDLKRLARNQARLLRLAAEFVKPGGRLVYSTCTVNPGENLRVVEKFLGSVLGWVVDALSDDLPNGVRRLRSSDGFFRTWPGHLDLDGFEMVVLRKNKGPIPGAGLKQLQQR